MFKARELEHFFLICLEFHSMEKSEMDGERLITDVLPFVRAMRVACKRQETKCNLYRAATHHWHCCRV
jgi:hypothetical protein